jgi:hypothetical protein
MLSKRMTEKRRLATAAAAMVTRMTTRSSERVLFPDSPRRKRSEACEAMAAGGGEREGKGRERSNCWMETGRLKINRASLGLAMPRNIKRRFGRAGKLRPSLFAYGYGYNANFFWGHMP